MRFLRTDDRPQLADEQIRAHTIGALKSLSSQILIVDYDPQWPDLFAREADRIRAVLGCRALRIVLVWQLENPLLMPRRQGYSLSRYARGGA